MTEIMSAAAVVNGTTVLKGWAGVVTITDAHPSYGPGNVAVKTTVNRTELSVVVDRGALIRALRPDDSDQVALLADWVAGVMRQLANPPEGWSTFGTHVDQPGVTLELWGELDGTPIWERPVPTGTGTVTP